MNGAFTYLAPARSRREPRDSRRCAGRSGARRERPRHGVRLVDGREVRAERSCSAPGPMARPRSCSARGSVRRRICASSASRSATPARRRREPPRSSARPHPIDRGRGWCARSTRRAPGRSFPCWPRRAAGTRGTMIDLHIYIGQNFDESFGAWFLWITASLQFARSRGRVRLTSADPMAPLDIDHAYLSDPADLEACATASSSSSGSSPQPPMQRVLEPCAEEMPPWGDAGELPAWAVSRVGTTFHPSSTCRMGPAPIRWRSSTTTAHVHGVAGLRVVDASIFPTGPRANLHFTVVAVAEKLADTIRRDPALTVSSVTSKNVRSPRCARSRASFERVMNNAFDDASQLAGDSPAGDRRATTGLGRIGLAGSLAVPASTRLGQGGTRRRPDRSAICAASIQGRDQRNRGDRRALRHDARSRTQGASGRHR